MGILGAFRKIGKGAIKAGKTLAKVGDVPGVTTVMTMIPVAGPVLAAAVKRANMAEKLFNSGEGDKKRAWATHQLEKDLKRLGISDKNIIELMGLGILVARDYAGVSEGRQPSDDKPKTPAKEKKPPRATARQVSPRKPATVGEDLSRGPLGRETGNPSPSAPSSTNDPPLRVSPTTGDASEDPPVYRSR